MLPRKERRMLDELEEMVRLRTKGSVVVLRLKELPPGNGTCGRSEAVILHGFPQWSPQLAFGRISYVDEYAEAVPVLAHEMGHIWDHLSHPDGGVALFDNQDRGMAFVSISLSMEVRAWDWSELFLGRVGFFRLKDGWKRYVAHRAWSLGTYDQWAERARQERGGRWLTPIGLTS